MSNQEFLKTALEQSFQKPLMTEYNNIDFVFCRDSTGCFLMGDKSECRFAPCLISGFQIQNYINDAVYDIKHSLELNSEYKTFKHYFEENVVITDKSPTMQSLRLWLDLTSVSRQAAQKKRVIATIMPPKFKETIAEMEKGYRSAIRKIEVCEKENLDAVEIALIKDFINNFHKILFKFHFYDIIFFANKLRLKKYINEALETILNHETISPNFELSHTFIGNNHKRFGAYADKYRSDMLFLISKLQNLSHNRSLLDLAKTYLQNNKQFAPIFKDFCNQRRAPNLDDILAIKSAAQTMFDEFTKLCYLEGVRRAFELNYLDQCPSPQNPVLPAICPNEEIGKIRNIVEGSHLIDCRKTKTGKFYYNSLANYRSARAKIDKILSDYIGTSEGFDERFSA